MYREKRLVALGNLRVLDGKKITPENRRMAVGCRPPFACVALALPSSSNLGVRQGIVVRRATEMQEYVLRFPVFAAACVGWDQSAPLRLESAGSRSRWKSPGAAGMWLWRPHARLGKPSIARGGSKGGS
jgi:hypothetical protein